MLSLRRMLAQDLSFREKSVPIKRRRDFFYPGLRHSSDAWALAVLTFQTGLMAGLFLDRIPLWLGLYPAGWLAVMSANVKHNHMHRRTFRARWPNLALDHWLGWLTGTTATSILTEHNLRHHGHSNTEHDFVRADLVGFRSQLLNVLCFFPSAAWELYIRKPLDFRLWWRTNRPLFWRALAEQASLWGIFTTLLFIDWRVALLCVALPWLHGQWWLVTFNLLQHQALAPDDPWHNSRNITGRWFNFFFFNVGFHTAHHLRPTLHWSELPAYHAREIAPRIDPRLVSPHLWAFYRDWFTQRSHPSPCPAAPAVAPARPSA
ncbi:MAG: fatty acid desaturase [Verrucomicrobia bacterium]|nr:fatty acid desaturase [Verrucomicrobiota bacterium]